MSLLVAQGLSRTYPGMGRPAVDGVSFELAPGAHLGIVGASGSGKSTLVRLVAGLEGPDAGTVTLDGEPVLGLSRRRARRLHARMQIVFQDHSDAFDPHLPVGSSLLEFGTSLGLSRRQARSRACELAGRVGLDVRLLDRRPAGLSGGQRQRAAMARALMPGPEVLLCDEVTSALDMSTQRQVVELLREITRGVSLVFVTHDLALLPPLCEEVMVMDQGRVVDRGPTAQVIAHPRHPCTRLLVDSARWLFE